MEIRPLLLGHRGARADKTIPENTLASFDLALAQGCDGFEFDVRLSKDGQAVICHNAASRGTKSQNVPPNNCLCLRCAKCWLAIRATHSWISN